MVEAILDWLSLIERTWDDYINDLIGIEFGGPETW